MHAMQMVPRPVDGVCAEEYVLAHVQQLYTSGALRLNTLHRSQAIDIRDGRAYDFRPSMKGHTYRIDGYADDSCASGPSHPEAIYLPHSPLLPPLFCCPLLLFGNN